MQNKWEGGLCPPHGEAKSQGGAGSLAPLLLLTGVSAFWTHCGTKQGTIGVEGTRSVWPLGQPTRAVVQV